MAIKQLFAGASLFLLAFAAAPMAQAANDGDSSGAPGASSPAPSTSPPAATRPHRTVDPAQRAARRAARKQRHEAHRQERLRARGTDPSATTGPAPN
jgi:hypothetical protein